MERTNGGTRALTTELKYLNLDYSEYQHLPEEEDEENDMYYGIEKGKGNNGFLILHLSKLQVIEVGIDLHMLQ